jgi:branched-chain amino acid transport system permease protein
MTREESTTSIQDGSQRLKVEWETARRWGGTIASLVALIALCASGPSFLSGYWVRVITGVFMWITITQSLNIISGYTGYPAFGNVVFFGLGAYAVAVLMSHAGVPWFLAVLAGGVICVLFAVLIGFPLLRLRGHYFAVASLAVMEATREIIINLGKLTGGGNGTTLPLMKVPTEVFFNLMYWVMLGIAIVCTLTTYLVVKSRWGFAFRAIKDDEDAAAVMGINTTKYKIIAWALSAFFTGLAGGVFAFWFSFIEPRGVFNMNHATKMFVMLLLGGAGTIIGPILGAFALEIVSELVWGQFLELHLGVLGVIIVLVIIFIPRGILDFARHRFSLAYLLENVRKGRL